MYGAEHALLIMVWALGVVEVLSTRVGEGHERAIIWNHSRLAIIPNKSRIHNDHCIFSI